MSRLVALLTKELRQHLPLTAALAAVLALAWLMVAAGVSVAPDTVTFLSTHQTFLWVFLPLAGLVIGNRLVVAEYQGRTQLFVEALPVRRIEMVAVKYALGLVVLWVIAGGSLLASVAAVAGEEPMSARFFGLLALRTAAFVFALWSLLFVMGFLGRLRVVLYIALFTVVFVIDEVTQIDIFRVGPFELVSDSLVLDRTTLPVAALALSVGLGVALTALAAALALVNEGSMAESLARRMTLKEKSVAGALVMAALMALTALDERAVEAPFEFQRDELLRSEAFPLEVLYVRAEARDDGAALLAAVEGDLEALAAALGRDRAELPPVRVALRESLDAVTHEPVELARGAGVLVRANFRRSPRFEAEGERALRALILRQVLATFTAGRSEFEPWAWVTDGFSRWLVEGEGRARCLEAPEACPLLLRALWVSRREPPSTATVTQWFRSRERLGEVPSRALAFSALLALERRRGAAAVEALARQTAGRPAPLDTRAVLAAWRAPLPERFHRSTSLELEPFVEAWAGDLERLRARPAVAEVLSQVPEAEVEVSLERGRGTIRTLRWQVRFDGAPPGQPTTAALLHRDLGPFDRPLERHELRREERLVGGDGPAAVDARLLGRYGPGSRVFLALELDLEPLGCPVRLLAERREIR